MNVSNKPSDRNGPGPADLLTRRQKEVLALLAKGLRNRAIAQRLHISEATVERHCHEIYTRLDVHSRLEAVARARDMGFL